MEKKMRAASTPSRVEGGKARGVALLGVLLAFILIVGLVERMIPLDFIVPGVRLGFSNIVILLALYIFRTRYALCLVVMKCVLLSALTGGVSSFMYSICGSMLSFAAMNLMVKKLGEKVGPVGVSVVGAICHIVGQLAVASLILESASVFTLLPPLMLISGASGVLVGVVVKAALRHLPYLNSLLLKKESATRTADYNKKAAKKQVPKSLP
jgi:heptaprenyl diphosphate synthase